MNYLVIDLEMCKVPKNYRTKEYKYANETIQIGAVLLDEEFKQIGRLSQYVHPEHGVIDHYIANLTGIQNCNVKKAPPMKEALEHLINWIGRREYHIYAWSGSDREQIQHEIKAKNIESESIDAFMEEERWVDYQAIFSERFSFTRPLSLSEALDRAEIDAEGRFHDGLADAINTGLLIEKLELHPEYELSGYAQWETDSKALGSSLGDMLAGLNLQII